jgi:hypothetical protein
VPAVASDSPGVSAIVAAYKAQFPNGTPSQVTLIGAVMFKMIVAGLQEACKAGDLSREGITNAFRTISHFDTGLGLSYDFTDPKKAPSISTYILQPSKTSLGGLKEIQGATTNAALAEYEAGKK